MDGKQHLHSINHASQEKAIEGIRKNVDVLIGKLQEGRDRILRLVVVAELEPDEDGDNLLVGGAANSMEHATDLALQGAQRLTILLVKQTRQELDGALHRVH